MVKFSSSFAIFTSLVLLVCVALAAPLPYALANPEPTPGWLRDKWNAVKSAFGSSSSISDSSSSSSSSSKKESSPKPSYSDDPPPYSEGARPPSYEEATRSSSYNPSSNRGSSGSSGGRTSDQDDWGSRSSLPGVSGWSWPSSGGSRGRPSNTYNTYNHYYDSDPYTYSYGSPGFGPSPGYRSSSSTYRPSTSTSTGGNNRGSTCGSTCRRNVGIVLGSLSGFAILIGLSCCCCKKYRNRPRRLSSLTASGGRQSFLDYFRKKKQKLNRTEFRRSLRRYSGFYSRRNRNNAGPQMQQTNEHVALPAPAYRPDGPSGTSPYTGAGALSYNVREMDAPGSRTSVDHSSWHDQVPTSSNGKDRKPFKTMKGYGYRGSKGFAPQEQGSV